MFYRRFVILSALLATTLAVGAQISTILKDAYRDSFHVGVAINEAQITGTDARCAMWSIFTPALRFTQRCSADKGEPFPLRL